MTDAAAGSSVVVRGAGSIGTRHAWVLASLGARVGLWPVRPREQPGSTDGGVCDAWVRILDDTAGRAALADADLVVVATDTGRHVSDAVAALDAGAGRVLVEKPVGPSVAAAAPLVRHPRSQDVWVAAPLRAHEAFRLLLRLRPRLGTPVAAHVWCQSWLPDWRPGRDHRQSYSARPDEGGVLRDLVHEIDYTAVLLGEPHLLGVHLVGAAHEPGGPLDIESEQAATLLWSTPDGSSVTARLDYTTRPSARGIVVRGPRGSLEWHVASGTVRHFDPSGVVTDDVFPGDLDRDHVMANQARAALDLAPTADPAQRHTAGAPATLDEAVAALALCDAARSWA